MTHPRYGEKYLNGLSLSDLKSLYSDLGCTRQVADKRAKLSWVTAILRFQEERAVKTELQLEEKTCGTCPKFDAERGCCKLFEIKAKSHWLMTNDCISEMEVEQTEVAEVAVTQPQEQAIEAQAEPTVACSFTAQTVVAQLLEQPTEPQIEPAVGYDFTVTHGFTFYQKQCDVMCWIGRKDKYRTIAYPELSNAVQEALRRLKKEGVEGADALLQMHIEAKKAKVQAKAKVLGQMAEGTDCVLPDTGTDCNSPSAFCLLPPAFTQSEWKLVAEPKKDIAICPDCDGHGCGNCGYRGTRNIDICTPVDDYRLANAGHTTTQVAFRAFNGAEPLGMIFRVRNIAQPIENVQDSYYWQSISNEQHSSVRGALAELEAMGTGGLTSVSESLPEDLLDKPFSKLTTEEWERLKEYKPTSVSELVAA
jgi:hypothetical protein